MIMKIRLLTNEIINKYIIIKINNKYKVVLNETISS